VFVFSGTYSALTGATVDIRRVFRMARLCTAAGLLALAIGSPVFVAGAPAQAAMTGSVDIALKALPEAGAADAGIMRLYGKSHALVISNTEYRNWPRLGNAVKNGRMISEALKEQGFGVTLVANLGHQAMIQTLEEFFTNKGKDSAARLLVVFNGHGHTIGDTGYLVPIDAPGPDDTEALARQTISLHKYASLMQIATARHVFSIFESAMAPTIFEPNDLSPPAAVTGDTALPLRQFFTVGGAGQPVPDDARFRKLLVLALRGEAPEADPNEDGYTSGTELSAFLGGRMQALTGGALLPQSGKLSVTVGEQGDFIFLVPEPEDDNTQYVLDERRRDQSTQSAQGSGNSRASVRGGGANQPAADKRTRARDRAAWSGASDDGSPQAYEGYLQEYPGGEFVDEARGQLGMPPVAGQGKSGGSGMVHLNQSMSATYTANVRAEPARGGKRIGTIPTGESVQVTGQTTDGQWFLVRMSDGREGYVRQTLLNRAAAAIAEGPGTVFQDCEDCPEMVVLAAGEFIMGSPQVEVGREADEGPVHRRVIRAEFALGRYEVTVGQFREFVEASAYVPIGGCSYFKGGWKRDDTRDWENPGFQQGDNNPVGCVSMEDAQVFVRWLSRKTGKKYYLPSEAEWEFAARAGTTTPAHWGASTSGACDYANVYDRTGRRENRFDWAYHKCDDGFGQTSPVGSFPANDFGLHDMLGNVWEWVADCWNDNYAGAPHHEISWRDGDCARRVLRGGSWNIRPGFIRAANRVGVAEAYRSSSVGFRIARRIEPQKTVALNR
jgi:formylglycine-generating enzyme required for sulfatase activity